MKDKKLVYNEDSITHLTGLDPIRVRPTAFIGSLDAAGQVLIARELIDNSCDELNNVPYAGELRVCLFQDKKRKTYQLMVIDNGRGFPLGKFKSLLTTLWESGKHKQDAYDTSGGLLGVGAKCQSALSSYSKAITLREGRIGVLDMRDGQVLHHDTVSGGDANVHGTLIVYEPAPSWIGGEFKLKFEMQEIPYFSETGYLDLVNLLRLRDIFNDNIRFIFQVFSSPLPKRLWEPTISPQDAISLIGTLENVIPNEIVYDSSLIVDKTKFLLEHLGMDSPVTWQLDNFKKTKTHADDKLSFQGRIIAVKQARKTAAVVLVNSIVMRTEANSPLQVTNRIVNNLISKNLTDPELKKFFLNSGYTPPLIIALSIRYSGAQFEGTTKNTFRDKTFEALYEKELIATFATLPENTWVELAQAILPDLEQKYNLFYNKPMEQKTTRNLILELNHPGNYTECRSADRGRAELFIVEGNSASHLKKALDNEYQALYSTRGKPFNAMKLTRDSRVAFQHMTKDPIFSDIIKITGITSNTRIGDGISFGKIVVTTDADPDGSHIGALYIGNFHMLNPEIITSGILYLATPALFVINLNKNKKLFLRNREALDRTRVESIYKNVLDIHIQDSLNNKTTKLEGDVYKDFCLYVLQLGEIFTNVSRQLNIPLLVLERLTYGIDYLVPSLQLDGLQQMFAYDNSGGEFVRIVHQPNLNMLVISVNEQDIPISLNVLGETIRTQLMPFLLRYQWRHWLPLVTTKLTTEFTKQPATLMQVYEALTALNSDRFMRIDRIKGLGEASAADLNMTVSNPNTRTLHQITSIGDVERVYALLGADVTERKNMMRSTGFLSSSMRA